MTSHEIDPDLARILEELLLSVRVRGEQEGQKRPVEFEIPYDLWLDLKKISPGGDHFVDPWHVERAFRLYLLILQLARGRGAKE